MTDYYNNLTQDEKATELARWIAQQNARASQFMLDYETKTLNY